jgi:preprotein translocase subunit YajC
MTEIAYAMGPGGGGAQQGGGLISLLPILIMFAIIYLLLILPQQKQQKKHAEMLKSLQKGDRVVAAGGIFGTVIGVDEARGVVVIKIDENVKIEVLRNSVSAKLEK